MQCIKLYCIVTYHSTNYRIPDAHVAINIDCAFDYFFLSAFSFAQFACFAGTKVLALLVQKYLRLLVQKWLLTCRPFSLVLISVAYLSNTQLLRCQYLYFCTSKAKSYKQLRCRYLYFCTSKDVSICTFVIVKTTSSCRPFSLVLISVAHLP